MNSEFKCSREVKQAIDLSPGLSVCVSVRAAAGAVKY